MISVCLATYNGERYLQSQLASILKQLGSDDEIIMSDDHSTDKTITIAKSFNDSRIKIIEGPAKGHPRYNFENALKHCKGDFIFLCDQDDVWTDDKVAVFAKYLNNYDLVVSDCTVIDGEGDEVLTSFQATKPQQQYGFLANLFKNHYLGCCMAFNRKLKDIVLPFPSKIAQHDIWIGLCAEAFKMKIIFIPNKLMHYRRHGHNFSQDSTAYSMMTKFAYRAYFIYHVIKRKMRR